MENKIDHTAEIIANGIMIGVQANKYHTNVYDTNSNDFNHSHLKRAAKEGYEQAQKDVMQKVVEWLVLNTETRHFTYETPRCFKKSFDESLEDLKKYIND